MIVAIVAIVSAWGVAILLALLCIVRAVKSAPQDPSLHAVEVAPITIPERDGFRAQLRSIRALPEAIGRHESENGRML